MIDMVEEILKFVKEAEDSCYEAAAKARENNQWELHTVVLAQAAAFQKVWYFIEDLLEKAETHGGDSK